MRRDMARKRKNLKHLDYQSEEYWNRLLAEEGLAVDTGRHPKLVLVGGSSELVVVEKMEFGKRFGRVRPKGASSDSDE
jgi:hypothetical protein